MFLSGLIKPKRQSEFSLPGMADEQNQQELNNNPIDTPVDQEASSANIPPAEVPPTPKPALKNNDLIFWGGIIILVAGSVFFSANFFSSNSLSIVTTPEVTPTETPSPVAGWYDYENTDFNFSLKYPPDFMALPKEETPNIGSGDFILGLVRLEDNQTTNIIRVNVIRNGLDSYRITGVGAGAIFHFDSQTGQRLNQNDQSLENAPKPLTAPVKAFVYKGGDMNCVDDIITIPNELGNLIVEIINITCDKSVGKEYVTPNFKLDSELLISTFSLTDEIIADINGYYKKSDRLNWGDTPVQCDSFVITGGDSWFIEKYKNMVTQQGNTVNYIDESGNLVFNLELGNLPEPDKTNIVNSSQTANINLTVEEKKLNGMGVDVCFSFVEVIGVR